MFELVSDWSFGIAMGIPWCFYSSTRIENGMYLLSDYDNDVETST